MGSCITYYEVAPPPLPTLFWPPRSTCIVRVVSLTLRMRNIWSFIWSIPASSIILLLWRFCSAWGPSISCLNPVPYCSSQNHPTAPLSQQPPNPTLGIMTFSGPRLCQHLAPGWAHSGSSVHEERLHAKGNYFFSISFSLKSVDVRLFGAVCCFSWFLHFPLFFMERVALISCKALQINIKVGLGALLEWSCHLLIAPGQEMLSTPEGRSFSKQDCSNKGVGFLHQCRHPPACILTTWRRMEILQNPWYFWTTELVRWWGLWWFLSERLV